MTEAEWDGCASPRAMLDALRGKASHRKLLLFACACCRRTGTVAADGRRRRAVEVIERFADGRATLAEVRASEPPAFLDPDSDDYPEEDAPAFAFHLAFCGADAFQAAVYAGSAAAAASWNPPRETALPVDLLRCLVGNPFRPVAVNPAWLAWQGGAIPRLAQAAYDQRELPGGHLDPAHLAVLADALEEAGCSDPHILGHLRSTGPHVRGCHVLDALLGKE
jgi:hypothetical protein